MEQKQKLEEQVDDELAVTNVRERDITEKKPASLNSPDIDRLISEIGHMNEMISSRFSKRQAMIRGLVTGFFTVIGATIVTSIAVSLLTYFFGDSIPYLSDLIND